MRVGLFPESETAPASGAASTDGPRNHPRFHRQQTLPLQLLAGELTGATDCFCLLPGPPLGGLFIMAASFISRKMPSRCIFFFSALRAWSTLLSRTKTCTWCSFSIKRLVGPTAKLSGHWHMPTEPNHELVSIGESLNRLRHGTSARRRGPS